MEDDDQLTFSSIEPQPISTKGEEIVSISSKSSTNVFSFRCQTIRNGREKLVTVGSNGCVNTYSARLTNSQVWTC